MENDPLHSMSGNVASNKAAAATPSNTSARSLNGSNAESVPQVWCHPETPSQTEPIINNNDQKMLQSPYVVVETPQFQGAELGEVPRPAAPPGVVYKQQQHPWVR